MNNCHRCRCCERASTHLFYSKRRLVVAAEDEVEFADVAVDLVLHRVLERKIALAVALQEVMNLALCKQQFLNEKLNAAKANRRIFEQLGVLFVAMHQARRRGTELYATTHQQASDAGSECKAHIAPGFGDVLAAARHRADLAQVLVKVALGQL